MNPIKSSEHIEKEENWSDRSDANDYFSLVTLNELKMKARKKHSLISQ